MVPVDPAAEGIRPSPELDPDSQQWIQMLSGPGPQPEEGLARLHALLLRVARGEMRRRGGRLQITGPELDDLAYQAAADALLAIVGKLGQFRGESRFTTWAYKFVIFEVSAKIGRHFWMNPAVPMDAEDWERLPDQFGLDPARETERRDLARAVRRAAISPHGSGRSSSHSCSTACPWTPWSPNLALPGMRSIRQCSTRDVSCGPLSPLTGIWTMGLRGIHERLVSAGPLPADRPARCGMR